MKNVKKALVLVLAVILILAFANISFATAIPTSNEPAGSGNNTANEPASGSENGAGAPEQPQTPINTTNTAENLPYTGSYSTINFALILLLTLVLGMFSLVQYNRIIKKDAE